MRRIATILAVIMLAGSSLGFMKLIQRRRAVAVSGGAPPPTPERYTNSVLFMPYDSGDVTSLTNFADRSDYANNGTSTNPPTWNAALGGYVDCDGTNYIKTLLTNSMNSLSAFAWIKGAPQSGKIIMSKYDYGLGDRSWCMAIHDVSPYNQLFIIVSDDGTLDAGHSKRYKGAIPSDAVADNNWHYVGFTVEPIGGTNLTLSLYVDGMEISAAKIFDSAITNLHTSGVPVTVSGLLNNGAPANYFTGSIDEPTVLPYVATTNGIMTAYLAGSTNGTGTH